MKLVEVGGSIYGTVNRLWYRAAVERFGQQVADEMHHEVWFADGGAGDHENVTISKLMGFEGRGRRDGRHEGLAVPARHEHPAPSRMRPWRRASCCWALEW